MNCAWGHPRIGSTDVDDGLGAVITTSADDRGRVDEGCGSKRTTEHRAFLDIMMGSPHICGDPIMVEVTTGPNEPRATWIHPQVAIHLALWCSPAFAVQVTAGITDVVNDVTLPRRRRELTTRRMS